MGTTYLIKVKWACKLRIQPNGISGALAELLAGRCGEERDGESHGLGQQELFLFPAIVMLNFWATMIYSDITDGVYTGQDVPKLIGASDLDLNALLGIQVPKVPRLYGWIEKLRNGHACFTLHPSLNAAPRPVS